MANQKTDYRARIPAETAAVLAALAKRSRRTVNAEILLAIDAWLYRQAPQAGGEKK